jgi:hypothetical protein
MRGDNAIRSTLRSGICANRRRRYHATGRSSCGSSISVRKPDSPSQSHETDMVCIADITKYVNLLTRRNIVFVRYFVQVNSQSRSVRKLSSHLITGEWDCAWERQWSFPFLYIPLLISHCCSLGRQGQSFALKERVSIQMSAFCVRSLAFQRSRSSFLYFAHYCQRTVARLESTEN